MFVFQRKLDTSSSDESEVGTPRPSATPTISTPSADTPTSKDKKKKKKKKKEQDEEDTADTSMMEVCTRQSTYRMN